MNIKINSKLRYILHLHLKKNHQEKKQMDIKLFAKRQSYQWFLTVTHRVFTCILKLSHVYYVEFSMLW